MLSNAAISLVAVAAIAVGNMLVSVQVLRCPMFSLFQKTAQCFIIWLLPLFGAIGIWAFLRSQYNWTQYDTRAFPERSEKMVLQELDQSGHDASGAVGEASGD